MRSRDCLHSNMLDLMTLPSGKVPQSVPHIPAEVKLKMYSPRQGFISPTLSCFRASITLWASCLDALYNQEREMGTSRMRFVCPAFDSSVSRWDALNTSRARFSPRVIKGLSNAVKTQTGTLNKNHASTIGNLQGHRNPVFSLRNKTTCERGCLYNPSGTNSNKTNQFLK